MSNEPDTNTTVVKKTELADIISARSRHNYGKVGGLKYYCGGRVTVPGNSSLVCETRVDAWINDIEARTAENWTEAGKIQIIKQYALGSAYTLITLVISEKGEDWDSIKQTLRKVFPDPFSYAERKAQATGARRNTGESITEFCIRLYDNFTQLILERPDLEAALKEEFVATFLTCMPPFFMNHLTEADNSDIESVYSKALTFIQNNPQLRLRNQDLWQETKETTQMVAAVGEEGANDTWHSQAGALSASCNKKWESVHNTVRTNPLLATHPPNFPQPPPFFPIPNTHFYQPSNTYPQQVSNTQQAPYTQQRNSNMFKCYRCKKTGHIARNCLTLICKTCNSTGHIASHCKQGAGRGRPSQGRSRPFRKSNPTSNGN